MLTESGVKLLVVLCAGVSVVAQDPACVCVPEAQCDGPDIDLRLDESECPFGEVCCEREVCQGTCVAEARCATPQVDLRVGLQDACPAGTICCDSDPTVVEPPAETCDGECKLWHQCPSEMRRTGADGENAVDLRGAYDDGACPANYVCCGVTQTSTACRGVCLYSSACEMGGLSDPDGSCPAGQVCCLQEQTSWMQWINEVNGMVDEPALNGGCQWDVNDPKLPWLVSIWDRSDIAGIQVRQFRCVGILVAASMILTTASCVKDMPTQKLFVDAGDYDLRSSRALKEQNIFNVRQVNIHEDYTERESSLNVAVLQLDRAVREANFVCLDDEQHTTRDCNLVGWSRKALAEQVGGEPKVYTIKNDEQLPAEFCDDVEGSPLLCSPGKGKWQLRALATSCTNSSTSFVAVKHWRSWLQYQLKPSFVQKHQPVDPSRQYLPAIL